MRGFDFPAWIRLTHFLNILFIFFLIRSGIEILAAHPKLYWNDASRPGSEWLRFTHKKMPENELWTSADEEESFNSIVALPGKENLGIGRHWHFFKIVLWTLTGLVYVVLLFADNEWRRLVPTSWNIFPRAWEALITYLSLRLPESPNGYNALQQLSYFGVVFILSPITILTGAAMSPAIAGRFPWYLKLFGGRQPARSIHFLCLLGFVAFTIVHLAMVIIHGWGRETALMIFGNASRSDTAWWVALAVLGALVVLHVIATVVSLRYRRAVKRLLGPLVDFLVRTLLDPLRSRQHYPVSAVSEYFRVNGRPPAEARYHAMAEQGFADWRFRVDGMVQNPLSLSLADLRALPKQSQTTKHNCIQGWSCVAQWGGVPVGYLLDLCSPLPGARYAVFRAMDDKATSEPPPTKPGRYFEVIDLELARHSQTILAYEMDHEPLPIEHGAPLRLRVENQLGYKMVKYLESMELVEDYESVDGGEGGWRERSQYYGQPAGI